MQLSLQTRPGQGRASVRPVPLHGVRLPWHDSASSQLDTIAAVNRRVSRHWWRSKTVWIAAPVGALVLVGASMWRTPRDEPPALTVSAGEIKQAAVVARPAPGPLTDEIVPPAAPAAAAALPVPEPGPEPVASVDDAARKARARQLADARRKAAEQAQERALAEDQAQQRAREQQQEAERARQLEAEARQRAAAAAEQARAAPAPLAQDIRRSVRDICAAAGGFFAEQLCRSRECRKPDHQGDPLCAQLREMEIARLRSNDN